MIRSVSEYVKSMSLRSAMATRQAGSGRGLANWLGEPDEVALAVVEERAELAGALARVVVGGGDRVAARVEARHLEALEGQSPGSQIGQGRFEVLYLESH